MRNLVYLVPTLAALLLALPADAGCRRVAVVQHQAVVVTPAVATFLAVPVPAYPVLGAGYGQGDVAGEIRALRQELGDAVRALRAAPASAPTVPAPAQPPAAMPREAAKASAPTAPEIFVDSGKLLAAVKASCARCHGPTNPKGGVALVTAAGELAELPQLTRLKAFRATSTGKMPPGGPPVADEALELFARWSE